MYSCLYGALHIESHRALDAKCGHHHTLSTISEKKKHNICGSQIKWTPNNKNKIEQKQQQHTHNVELVIYTETA